MLDATRASARVTHAHPLGIEGAVLIALAAHGLLEGKDAATVLEIVRSACSAPPFAERLATLDSWIVADAAPTPGEVARRLGNGMTAPTSCPTGLYLAVRYLQRPFEEMMRFITACGGDVDTIGSMAGVLWGIVNGPANLPAVNLEGRRQLVDVATRLHARQASLQ